MVPSAGEKIVRFRGGGDSWVSQVRSVAKSVGDPRFDAQISYENFKVFSARWIFLLKNLFGSKGQKGIGIYRDVIVSPHLEPTK